jgi:hypothetical protein
MDECVEDDPSGSHVTCTSIMRECKSGSKQQTTGQGKHHTVEMHRHSQAGTQMHMHINMFKYAYTMTQTTI